MSDLLFTQSHVLQHGTEWTFKGKTITSLCVLCVIEKLDCSSHSSNNNQLQQLTVFVKTVLNELIELFNNKQDTSIITRLLNGTDNASSSSSVLEQLCRIIMGLLVCYKSDVQQLIIKVLAAVFSHSNSTDLHRTILRETLHHISAIHNFTNSMGQMSLLGQLLHVRRHLSKDIIQLHGAFLWYLVEGITYPDETVKSLVVYVFVQLCYDDTNGLLPVNIINELCRHVPASLAGSRLNDLTINLMGLIQCLVHTPLYAQCLLQVDHVQPKDTNIASALKRVLLSNEEVLQLSGLQCITNILANDTEYITVLVTADLPVYLFEILSSDNDRLVCLSLECLVSISTTTIDLFSSCHALFGYDALLNAVEKALTVKNYTAVQSGMILLTNLLDRPSLITNTRAALDRIIVIITNSLLHVPCKLCATLFANILRPEIIPSERKLDDFFPPLSLFLKQVQVHISSEHAPPINHTSASSSNDPADIQGVLLIVRNISNIHLHRLSIVTDQTTCLSDCDITDIFGYLMTAMETKLIPYTLLLLGTSIQSQQSFMLLEHLFDILTTLFLLNEDYSTHLALHLVEAGFIQLVLDFKSKHDRSKEFDCVANKFIEELCYRTILWDTADKNTEEAEEMKKALHLSLPNITCNLDNSLTILLQRVNLQVSDSQYVTMSCQRTILCLLYYLEKTHKEPVVSPEILFNTLNGYLSLNSEPHLLPSSTLKHLVALYSSTSLIMSVGPQMEYNTTTGIGQEIICQSLVKLPNPSLIFTHHISLLVWAYSQHTLTQVAKHWLENWLDYMENNSNSNECKELVHSVNDISRLLDNALDILVYGLRGMQAAVNLIKEIMTLETTTSSASSYVLNKMECVCMTQNIHITNLSSVLAVLSHLSLDNNLKLICQIVAILSNSLCSDGNDENISLSILLQGLRICQQALSDTSLIRVQVSELLVSNDVIMKQALMYISKYSNEIELLSVCLDVVMLLMDISHNEYKIKIPFNVLIKLLLSTGTRISLQMQVLKLWCKIFSTNGMSQPFYISYDNNNNNNEQAMDTKSLRILAFILINLISKDDPILIKNASNCFSSMLLYARNQKTINCHQLVSHDWLSLLCQKLKMFYQNEPLPCECQSLIKQISSDMYLDNDLQEALTSLQN